MYWSLNFNMREIWYFTKLKNLVWGLCVQNSVYSKGGCLNPPLPPAVAEIINIHICIWIVWQNRETAIDLLMKCENLNSNIPRISWSEPLLCNITKVQDAVIEFISCNFISIINSASFDSLDKVGWTSSHTMLPVGI